MKIHCCGCKKEVEARLTNGSEVYPDQRLSHLHLKRFYICDTCGNYVGIHKDSDQPLGSIPTPALRKVRMDIHAALDPLWQRKKISRTELYSKLAFKIGVLEFHTANIDNMATANLILKEISVIKDEINA